MLLAKRFVKFRQFMAFSLSDYFLKNLQVLQTAVRQTQFQLFEGKCHQSLPTSILKLLITRITFINWDACFIFCLQMISNQLIFLLLAVLSAFASDCPPERPEFFTTFHPHLDAFWLDTDDDLKNINFHPAGFLYAMNQRNSKTILNSMLDALTKNATRKYFVTEAVFLKDWYDYLTPQKKKDVKRIIENGQLEIPNGGWVENDEAVCYVDDIIDQYTIGHNWLDSQFDKDTRIGWATDSFGHSHSQVAIEHLLGMEFQGIERIDDRYIYDRIGGPLLQFYWSSVSDSNNLKYGGVLTYIRHFLHEVNDLRQTNAQAIAMDYANLEKNMQSLYKINKYFRFLGNDFEQFITQEFQNLEQALKKLNEGNTQCPKFQYGNPTDYLESIKPIYQKGTPVRQHDFIPNFDQDHYWAGYYTTNPQLKKICKDFSRLVNLFRKIYVKYLGEGGKQEARFRQLLTASDELLSVMQHHDGITATSKYHIETAFQDKMKSKSAEIVRLISEMKGASSQTCNLYQSENKCTLSTQEDIIYLSVMHEGAIKKERVELIIPGAVSYEVLGDQTHQVFCHPSSPTCTLVFEPTFLSGENVFILQKIDKSADLQPSQFEGTYSDNDFKISFASNQINYQFNNGEFIKLNFVQSPNRHSSTDTYTWDKYGRKNNKQESRIPGIYIMANTGQIIPTRIDLDKSYITKGAHFTKIYFIGKANSVVITIKNTEKNIIDLQTNFTPQTRELNDYFIQVQSKLDSKGQFYHDSNGYLVIKRKVAYRPDYNWNYKTEDKINANTYPMCSFAYAIDGDKKLVIFTDRAQGFAQFDNSYLINIDRLTADDYKGVGQGYANIVNNVFQHKIGIVAKNQFIQRQWQRSYDDALVGFYSSSKRKTSASGFLSEKSKFLKYTIFLLNQDEYVLRIFNLAQNGILEIPQFTLNNWVIPELNLNLEFKDIKQSFANGLPLSERHSWVQIEGQINIFGSSSRDTKSSISLQPLQIRSFRINTKQPITLKEKKPIGNHMLGLTLTDIQTVTPTFTKRCF